MGAVFGLVACSEATRVERVIVADASELRDFYEERIERPMCLRWAPSHAVSVSRCRDWAVVSVVSPEAFGAVEAVCALPVGDPAAVRLSGLPRNIAWCARFEGEGDVPRRATYYGDVDESCLGVPHRGGPATTCFLCGGFSAPCVPGMTLEASCDAP